jgi:hypothetical protein
VYFSAGILETLGRKFGTIANQKRAGHWRIRLFASEKRFASV